MFEYIIVIRIKKGSYDLLLLILLNIIFFLDIKEKFFFLKSYKLLFIKI